MSQEIIDLEEDRAYMVQTFINLKINNYKKSMKSIKEKDLMIDELNKKIRFLKFDQEKKVKDLENEINTLKEKLQNSEQTSKVATYEHLLEEMEKNLTNTENEMLKLKETEGELKKQSYNYKSENANLRNEIEKLKESSEELKQMRQNFEEMQNKITDGAIEAILEKENELIALREKYSELESGSGAKIESLNNEINSLQEKLFKSGIFLRESADVSFEPNEFEKLRDDNEKMKREFDIERAELLERIEILTTELEKEIVNFEQSKQNLEKEVNEKAYQKLKEQLEQASKSEYTLLEELQKYDEQLRTYENQSKNYEKKLNAQEERHMKEIDFYKKKADELERNLLAQKEEKKSQSKLESQYNELKDEFDNKMKENSNIIKSLEKLKEKDMQKILKLEADNKNLSQKIDKLKINILELETAKNELEEKIKNTIQECEDKLTEASMQRDRAKSELKYSRGVRPSNVYKVSEESNLGSDLFKATESRPSINISPYKGNLLSNELKDFNCEENWPQADIKEFFLNSTKAGTTKKKFDFPGIKITDFDKGKVSSDTVIDTVEPIIERAPKLSVDPEKISRFEKQMLEYEKENQNLKDEIKELKENLYQEIEKYRVKEEEITKKFQNQRRQTLDGLRMLPSAFIENIQMQNQGQGLENLEKTFQQLEALTIEKKELEGKYLKLKREYEDEKKFLEEELKNAEEVAISAKLQYAIIATEKDYYVHELKVIILELKRKKINIEYTDKKKNLGILSMFMCNCKTD